LGEPVVIVGASLAGLRCAEALRRNKYLGPIKIIGDEPHFPYNRPPLSKDLLSTELGIDEVLFPLKDSISDVEWVLNTAASSVDTKVQVVTDLSGTKHPYSYLVIATGLRPKPLPVDSNGISGIHVLRTIDDAISLRGVLTEGARVLILGAGFIGCEVAATSIKKGCEVRVVSRHHEPIEHALGKTLSAEIKKRHIEKGVEFVSGASVFGLIGDGVLERVILDSGLIYDTDVLVVAIGSIANTEWLIDSGIDITDGVLVDSAMRAIDESGNALQNVFAIGDVARYPNALFDEIPRRVEHWNLPSETAKRAAEVIVASQEGDKAKEVIAKTFGPLPSFWSDQYEMNILSFGMTYLANESRLVAGEISGECVFEYYREGELVGVCGIGMRPLIQSYRTKFEI
jgi:3-phenylpropionate/trans-cinnamate dioxygenase ferredoxin reductase component